MNGPEIFNFTLRVVPDVVAKALEVACWKLEDVDYLVMHQANRYMIDHLRKKLKVPPERVPIVMSHCGNTVSSTIPLALEAMEGSLLSLHRIMLVGFGVGYSWGAIPLIKSNC
jgi:3-oxoacyl-[acyl-carrier-protein] synthase-3